MTALAEALTVTCPKCGAGKGQPCVYVNRHVDPAKRAGWPDVPFVTHFEGDPITGRAHYERNDEFIRWERANRPPLDDLLAQYEARQKRIAETWAAMRAWDRAEYARLRDWLRDWGYLLTQANLPRRPDGTLRGETYLFGQ